MVGECLGAREWREECWIDANKEERCVCSLFSVSLFQQKGSCGFHGEKEFSTEEVDIIAGSDREVE